MHTKHHRPMTTADMRRNVQRNTVQSLAKALNDDLQHGMTRAGSDGKSVRVTSHDDYTLAGTVSFQFSTPSDARRALRLARKLIEMERGEQAPVFVPDADNDWED